MKIPVRFLLLITLVLGACVPAADDTGQAKQALVEFFDALNQSAYDKADQLYGGDYQVMMNNNPSVDPANHHTLWEHACAFNGFQCLPVRTASLVEMDGDEYVFIVEFSNLDGSLFILGPCCGATEAGMPPVSQFEYRVQKTEGGKFVVLDLPVYVP